MTIFFSSIIGVLLLGTIDIAGADSADAVSSRLQVQVRSHIPSHQVHEFVEFRCRRCKNDCSSPPLPVFLFVCFIFVGVSLGHCVRTGAVVRNDCNSGAGTARGAWTRVSFNLVDTLDAVSDRCSWGLRA